MESYCFHKPRSSGLAALLRPALGQSPHSGEKLKFEADHLCGSSGAQTVICSSRCLDSHSDLCPLAAKLLGCLCNCVCARVCTPVSVGESFFVRMLCLFVYIYICTKVGKCRVHVCL